MPDGQQHHLAVVTGGGGGLGREIARRLHREGYRVAIADHDESAARELAAEMDRGYAFAVDVADPSSIKALADKVRADLGSVQVLVNNAARTQARPLMSISVAELDDVMRINLGGTFHACQVFGRAMADAGYGRIINVASLAGQNGGTATGGHYAASKGAILAATKVFARELAPRGVTVNAVSPGPLDSPMVRELVGEGIDDLVAGIPVGHLGSMPFIARIVSLLASPEASSVTGACWDANGGLYLR